MTSLQRPDRPLSNQYDAQWLAVLEMGPHPLWLLEDLLSDLDIRPGMRVLDLGSGRGATSVMLARDLGAEVWAVDRWVSPAEVERTFAEMGVADRARAVQADARALPFQPEFFDAVVCIDAYEYFGTDDHYLPHLARFVRPGGQIGIASAAMRTEPRDVGGIPEHIRACVGWEAAAWHTADWWRAHWELTGLVDVTSARLQRSGWSDWLAWARYCSDQGGAEAQAATISMLEADQGHLLTFAMVAARVSEKAVP